MIKITRKGEKHEEYNTKWIGSHQTVRELREVYFCPAGYLTMGYGHVVKNDEDFSAGIDEKQAEYLLRLDAEIAERAVLCLINVLVPFTYNLGGGALQRSTLRRKIKRKEHAEVLEQFMGWGWGWGWAGAGLYTGSEIFFEYKYPIHNSIGMQQISFIAHNGFYIFF